MMGCEGTFSLHLNPSGRITVDKRLSYVSLKSPSATPFIRESLGEMLTSGISNP
jgi:hypothetical protein